MACQLLDLDLTLRSQVKSKYGLFFSIVPKKSPKGPKSQNDSFTLPYLTLKHVSSMHHFYNTKDRKIQKVWKLKTRYTNYLIWKNFLI
ncbi:hypothetical protein BpHYR1_023480 [Brachionus plicatilis]|uniref:Uncharacterized protein n=1 Tax=Brachionus plicatilis TaxID=10195 RepID=A0A3M7SE60_BRAPC|nr:hypothetical protein BpHYR1_023480 [Brachionus plicatilis]